MLVLVLLLSVALGVFSFILIRLDENDFQYYLGAVLLILAFSLFAFSSVSLKIKYDEPSKKYIRLVNDIDRAEKELQKFLIDYPEFKE